MRQPPHVYNARLSALSTMLHNLAVASIVGGAIAPLLAAYGGSDETLSFLITMPVGMLLGLAFAFLGQVMLKDLYTPDQVSKSD